MLGLVVVFTFCQVAHSQTTGLDLPQAGSSFTNTVIDPAAGSSLAPGTWVTVNGEVGFVGDDGSVYNILGQTIGGAGDLLSPNQTTKNVNYTPKPYTSSNHASNTANVGVNGRTVISNAYSIGDMVSSYNHDDESTS
jgi:hypothetical protein